MTYEPKPMNTENVELPKQLDGLVEHLASNAHDLWAQGRMGEGWKHGLQRDDAKKEHPDLVPYEELPDNEKEYDRQASIGTLKAIRSLGYRIVREIPRALPNGNEALRDFYGTESVPQIPLVLSVTGHMKIAVSEMLEGSDVRQAVQAFLKEAVAFWKKYSRPSQAPILVLCGMARGADTLVAEEVLRLKEADASSPLKLVAVLPMPKDFFKQDFAKYPDALERFEFLFKKADARLEIPLLEQNIGKSGSELDRTSQYVQLARYFAENSSILLALWDGELVLDRGGSYDTLRIKLEGASPFLEGVSEVDSSRVLAIQPLGGVYHIKTPREGGTQKVGTFCVEKATPIVSYPTTPRKFFQKNVLGKTIRQLAELNRFMAKRPAGYEEKREKSAGYLFKKPEEAPNTPHLKFLFRFFTSTDALAGIFQARYHVWVWLFLFLMTLTASLTAVIFYHYKLDTPLNPWTNWDTIQGRAEWFCGEAICRYLCTLCCAVLLFVVFAYRKSYELYHRYRAVAEALRVQIFWQMGGLPYSVMDEYWNHQVPELHSLRLAMKTLTLPIRPEPTDLEKLQKVKERWVEDQRGFYAKGIKKNIGHLSWVNPGIFACMVVAVIWYVLRLFSHTGYVLCGQNNWGSLICLGLALSGVTLAVLYAYRRCWGCASYVERYSKALPIFHYATCSLSEIQKACEEGKCNRDECIELQKKVLYTAGKFALAENADWYLNNEKMELPHA